MGQCKPGVAGERHGRLVAIRPTTLKAAGNKAVKWEWQCDCGDKTLAIMSEVRSGNTQSCGCLRREMVAKRNTKPPKPVRSPSPAISYLGSTAIKRSDLCADLPMRAYKDLIGHEESLRRRAAMCEATR